MSPLIAVVFILVVFLIIIFTCFRYKLYESAYFPTIISLFVIFNFLISIFSIYNTTKNFENTLTNTTRTDYDCILRNIYTHFSDFFVKNEDMVYLFNELYNGVIPTVNRNKLKEQLFFFLLFSHISNYCTYYYRHIKIPEHKCFTIKQNKYLVKFLNFLSNSDTFKKYFIDYLDKVAPCSILTYIKEFHLKP